MFPLFRGDRIIQTYALASWNSDLAFVEGHIGIASGSARFAELNGLMAPQESKR